MLEKNIPKFYILLKTYKIRIHYYYYLFWDLSFEYLSEIYLESSLFIFYVLFYTQNIFIFVFL